MMKNLDVPNMGALILYAQNNDKRYPGDGAVLQAYLIGKHPEQQKIDAASRATSTDNDKDKVKTETRNLTRNVK